MTIQKKKIEVQVFFINGSSFTMLLEENITISQIKEQIQNEVGVPIARQAIIVDRKERFKDEIIAFKHGDRLDLIITLEAGGIFFSFQISRNKKKKIR